VLSLTFQWYQPATLKKKTRLKAPLGMSTVCPITARGGFTPHHRPHR